MCCGITRLELVFNNLANTQCFDNEKLTADTVFSGFCTVLCCTSYLNEWPPICIPLFLSYHQKEAWKEKREKFRMSVGSSASVCLLAYVTLRGSKKDLQQMPVRKCFRQQSRPKMSSCEILNLLKRLNWSHEVRFTATFTYHPFLSLSAVLSMPLDASLLRPPHSPLQVLRWGEEEGEAKVVEAKWWQGGNLFSAKQKVFAT